MSLIECDECGRRISDKSLFCPGCGYPTHLNKALREPVTEATSANAEVASSVIEGDAKMPETPVQVPAAETTVAPESAAPEAVSPEEGSAEAAAPDALAEYEATLDTAPNPRRNERRKLWLYFFVLALLLGAVALCYYYSVSNHLGSLNEVSCEPVEEVFTATPDTIVATADTTAVAGEDTIPEFQASPAVRQL